MTKVLISGANRGIGFETSLQLAKQGYEVILGIRNPKEIDKTINNLVEKGIDENQLQGIRLDLNDSNSIQDIKRFIEKDNQDLSILVNNAGIAGDMSKGALDTSADEYQSTLDTNFFGNLRLIQSLLPILRKNFNSQIINITGPYEGTKWYNPAAYRVSKVALDALIQSFAADFINNKIDISIFGLFPGGVTTALNGYQNNSFMKDVGTAGKEIVNIINQDNHIHNGQIIDTKGNVLNKLN